MSYKVYPINRGVGRPIEFKGLKGQYIIYLAAGLVGLLLLLAILYLIGLPPYPCMGAVLLAGACLFQWVYYMNRRYGQYGRMKYRAARKIPRVIFSRSRKVFLMPEEIKQ